jgi:hypothetical protein
MSKKRVKGDPSAAYVRRAIAARRVGERRCACGENRPEALIPERDPIICHKCLRIKEGKTTSEDHHPAGDANDPTTIPVPVNDHRAELNVAQYAWPKATLGNPDGNPLLARAAGIRGYVDTNDYLIEKLLLPGAEACELLDALLTERFGKKWWMNTALKRFVPDCSTRRRNSS